MYDTRSSVEARLEELAGQVRVLTARVEELARARELHPPTAPHRQDFQRPQPAADEPASALWEHLTGATVLSSVAVACFLLAVALVLRTLVDNDIMNRQIGAYIGLVYASALIGYGYYQYARARQTIPVFVTCGLIMLFSIVLETHNRFELIPVSVAFALLAGSVVVSTQFGRHYRVPSVTAAAILGAMVVGLVLEFPHPVFSYLGLLMVLAALAAYTMSVNLQWRWIPWCILAVTGAIWLIWTMKGRALLLHPELEGHPSTIAWHLPVLAGSVAVYMGMPVWAAVREHWPYRAFERAIPLLIGTGAYFLAAAIIRAGNGRLELLGHAGMLVALGCASLAVWLAGRNAKGLDAAPSWMIAALVLLAVAAPASLLNIHLIVLVEAAVALGAGYLGHRWGSATLFRLACAYQVYACAQAIVAGDLLAATPVSVVPVVVAAIIAAIAYSHYVLCRGHSTAQNPEPIEDIPSFLLLFLALLYSFAVVRPMLYAALMLAPLGVHNTFHCSQSVLINAAALGLAVAGASRRDRLILVMAFLVASIGAAKVFAYDLTHCQGLPLVASVSFFGLTAAGGSLIWKRWQRHPHGPAAP